MYYDMLCLHRKHNSADRTALTNSSSGSASTMPILLPEQKQPILLLLPPSSAPSSPSSFFFVLGYPFSYSYYTPFFWFMTIYSHPIAEHRPLPSLQLSSPPITSLAHSHHPTPRSAVFLSLSLLSFFTQALDAHATLSHIHLSTRLATLTRQKEMH